jgi:predicted nucleic acid-binding protein
MTYLVDANVLSELAKQAPNSKVVDWLSANERHVFVDAIILGELHIGILALPQGRKRTQLERWFATVVETIECLPWDAAIARRWGHLVINLRRTGRVIPILDAMIAATAIQYDLTVVTGNVRDFRMTGAKVLNPFG